MAEVSTANAENGPPVVMAEAGRDASGPVLFARFAYPPNQHGYCGPDDADGFFTSGVAGDDTDLRDLARSFDGALPFLRLIADANGYTDPLDPRVVEAYWLGGPELDVVDAERPFDGLRQRNGHSERHGTPAAVPSGPLFGTLGTALALGAVPHHSFVVFCVYPWVAMLGDERRTPQAMRVLDGCRIRWGRVLEVAGDTLTAESQPLLWDGRRLAYGSPVVETVRRAIDGRGLAPVVTEGDWVALHWDWVCDRITEQQRMRLETYSERHLQLVNETLARRRVQSSGDIVASRGVREGVGSRAATQ